MALVRWEPFQSGIVAVQPFHGRRAANVAGAGRAGLMGAPHVYEKGDHIIVDAEIPGLKKEDIEVTVENQTLHVRGEKKETNEVKRDGSYQSERFYGKFHRVVTLPAPVDVTKIEAAYKDGVLTVTLPKSADARGRHIAIK